MSNNVDPDETAHYEPSHLDLRCLQNPLCIAYGSERVNSGVVLISSGINFEWSYLCFFFFFLLYTYAHVFCFLLNISTCLTVVFHSFSVKENK